MLRRLAVLTVLAFCVLGPGAPARAVMETPADRFRTPTKAEAEQILEIGKIQWFAQRAVKIGVQPGEVDDTKVFIVRICGAENLEFCPTAFFLHGLSDQNFFGLSVLPRFSSWSDRIFTPCEGCARVHPLVFYESTSLDDVAKSVGISSLGVIF